MDVREAPARRLLRAPMVHFVALGVAIFVLHHVVTGPRGGGDRRVVVDDAAVAAIVQLHQATWKRSPTPAELKGLIEAHVRDEVLYREGVALGLDRDDALIRRRVQQKIAVVAEESGGRPGTAAMDAELQGYLDKHAERYARPAIVGFEQVMFDPAKRGGRLRNDLEASLARLRAGDVPDAMGDSTLLPVATDPIAADLVARDYGAGFAASLLALPIGAWSGPHASNYGVHLVRVTQRRPGRAASLGEARAELERDWENERRAAAVDAYYRKALRKYDVVIDAVLPDGAAPAAGG